METYHPIFMNNANNETNILHLHCFQTTLDKNHIFHNRNYYHSSSLFGIATKSIR